MTKVRSMTGTYGAPFFRQEKASSLWLGLFLSLLTRTLAAYTVAKVETWPDYLSILSIREMNGRRKLARWQFPIYCMQLGNCLVGRHRPTNTSWACVKFTFFVEGSRRGGLWGLLLERFWGTGGLGVWCFAGAGEWVSECEEEEDGDK